jgi:hypothetical protein
MTRLFTLMSVISPESEGWEYSDALSESDTDDTSVHADVRHLTVELDVIHL